MAGSLGVSRRAPLSGARSESTHAVVPDGTLIRPISPQSCEVTLDAIPDADIRKSPR
jgi:hypothetical protein